jgi:hypothetical protein
VDVTLGQVGATLHLCASSDYYRYGGDLAAMEKLNGVVAAQLRSQVGVDVEAI